MFLLHEAILSHVYLLPPKERKMKKELLFVEAKLQATNQPGSTPTMHVHRKKSLSKLVKEEPEAESNPELWYSFQRSAMVIPLSTPSLTLICFLLKLEFL